MSAAGKISIAIFCIALVGFAGLVWFVYKERNALEQTRSREKQAWQKEHDYPPPPKILVNNSIAQTIRTAGSLGWVPCPGECLKLTTPGWHHQHVEGYPDTDIWFNFKYAGGRTAFSQRHIGHIINVHSDRPAEDIGECSECQGTGWIRKKQKK